MKTNPCKTIGCRNTALIDHDHCIYCLAKMNKDKPSMSEKYPKYYKKVQGLTEIDVYAVHHLFDIQDPSGAIQHASKKLLLSGVRTGGKSQLDDIREARDTLTRYLELQEALA